MIRVGIVGVGWGARVQAPAFQAVPGYELVGLCARTPERLAKAAGKLGVSDVSTDWRSFVERNDLDLISVATPTGSHREITLAALAAGKAVLCEKPLALDAAGADELVRAAAASDRPAACCFESRWLPDRLALWDAVRGGYLGTPYYAQVNRSASYWHPSHPLQATWMYDRDQGGGYLSGILVHDLDLICTLLGDPVAVCAEVRTTVPRRELPDGGTLAVTADDTAALLLRLASGALAVLSVSVMGAHADHVGLELFGSNGTIVGSGTIRGAELRAARAEDPGLAPLPLSDRRPPGDAELPGGLAGSAIRATALMLADWLPAFDGQPTDVPTFADGARAIAVTDAARRSAEGAGWVSLRR
ncbi:Gfo/Idh/MocA family protein [Cryptosporangium aurantiacum]|uniref:Predicted dehydrogenase n=1 Tax=Cryptosporangium aurantiacum TaxID=134849 RepID=A0A1M7PMS4_9ACTN|nr:Gfo/Idh/MocA family oxidoreductase [Cryptosporangium aurantiacum]SHN18562.1 Predicted dehydrogenase [Cryptosporangium aurantiacum]